MRRAIGIFYLCSLLTAVSFVGVSNAQIHSESPFKIPGPAQIVYTMKLLRLNFPENLDLLEKTNVSIASCHEIQAFAWQKDGFIFIVICNELFDILDSEDEYVAVLGHEFGHAKLGHAPAYKIVIRHTLRDFYPSLANQDAEDPPPYTPSISANLKFWLVPDYEILNKQEPEADTFSVEALRKNKRDACAMQSVLKKIAKLDNWYEKNPTEADTLGKKRIAALEEGCPRPKN